MSDQEVVDKLIEILDVYEGRSTTYANQGQAMDGYSALHNFVGLAKQARKERRE